MKQILSARIKGFILCTLLCIQVTFGFLDGPMNVKKVWKDEEETPDFWLNLGKEELDKSVRLENLNRNVAKNVIFFLGDGMSIPTITASRILKGQKHGKSGVEATLEMDKFQHVGLSKTYTVDKQVGDSAASCTAFLCGVKATFFTLGVSAAARLNNCSSVKGNEVESILVDAFRAGKSTGIVTTTRINHATPAGAYAHSASRMWYDDSLTPEDALKEGCKDIAEQFYDQSHMITVALGGGRRHFRPNTTYDPEYPDEANSRLDGQDLISKWMDGHKKQGLTAKYVWNLTEFDKVDPAHTDCLLGMFEPTEMHFHVDKSLDKAGEPSLTEMMEKALQILQKNDKGYFLLVEGGLIDTAHHLNSAYKALHETLAFDDAIAKARSMTSDEDTLIIATADHSHTLNFGGMTDRGISIFGLAEMNGEVIMGTDKKPFTSLLYGNGPSNEGFDNKNNFTNERMNLTNVDTGDKDFHQQSAVTLSYATHAGEDVAIMAQGPMAHLIHGVHQQSYIAYVMRYASCLGKDKRHCEKKKEESAGFDKESLASFIDEKLHSKSTILIIAIQFILVMLMLLFLLALCYLTSRQHKLLSTIASQQCESPLLDRKMATA